MSVCLTKCLRIRGLTTWLEPARTRELATNVKAIQWQPVADLPSRALCNTAADVPWDDRLPAEFVPCHKVGMALTVCS